MVYLRCTQIPNDNVYGAYAEAVSAAASAAQEAGDIQTCEDAGYDPNSICSANRNQQWGCYVKTAADASTAAKQQAANALLSMYPTKLQWTFAGGATTDSPVAYTVPGCSATQSNPLHVFVCSHVTPSGGYNKGVEYPFWVSNSFMNGRFVQFDMRSAPIAPAGVFAFTDADVDCSQFGSQPE